MLPEMSEEEYVTQIYTRVVQAMVTLDSDGTDVGGFVDPELAQKGLCMVIGVMAAKARPDMTPKEQREMADWCRKLILKGIQAGLREDAGPEQVGFRVDSVKRHKGAADIAAGEPEPVTIK
ncbi:hypothetical protein ACFSCW_03375 [Sphingomonas tabacisoli]|uniref:Uncharacterized protein n=1 Tax=Sphingomonas tabacisoli TaxID=2249466 RepID=A0ABW4HZ17_9SPHN